MATPYTFYYNGQIKNYIAQFMRIFSGLQVEYGVDRDNDTFNDKKTCAMSYGSMDRVVANVLHKEGTFVASSMPRMSAYLTNIELAPELRKPTAHRENVTYTRESDGNKYVTERIVGVPYRANMDLSIYTTNTEQMFQLMEQILLMFNPHLVIQKSNDPFDASYLTKVEMLSISNEESVPVSTDTRLITQTLSFNMDIWLNYPLREHDKLINDITLNVKDDTIDPAGILLDTANIDENGVT